MPCHIEITYVNEIQFLVIQSATKMKDSPLDGCNGR